MNDPMSAMSLIRTTNPMNPMNPMSTFSPMDPSWVRSTMNMSNPMGTASREAYGLASLGRGQDSMLVHMSPDEVFSLQNLARANGGSLTTNPDTGLPEAETLSSILPAFADQASNPFITGGIAGLKAMNSGIASFGVGGSVEKNYFPEYTSTFSSYDPNRSLEQLHSFPRGNVPVSASFPIPAADLPRPGTYNVKNLPLGRPDIAAANYGVTYENAASWIEKLWPHRTEKAGGSRQIYNKMLDWASPEKIIERGGNPNDTQWKLMNHALATGKVDPRLKPRLLLNALGVGLSETARYAQHKSHGNFFTRYLMNPLITTGLSVINPALGMAYAGIKGAVENGPLGGIMGLVQGYVPGKVGSMFGHAEGGYLSGRGDGMSDDIRATIDGKQPARLSAGEFVIPADVVGHLGNGSSEAGAKKLYAMMDKVRSVRTGTIAQGREIDADRYLPA